MASRTILAAAWLKSSRLRPGAALEVAFLGFRFSRDGLFFSPERRIDQTEETKIGAVVWIGAAGIALVGVLPPYDRG